MPPRIPYVDPATVTDPELKTYLDDARLHGTPRPESQAIRSHQPEILRTFSQTWNASFKNGVLENRLKELCRVFVSKAIDCEYWGVQRSVRAGQQGLSEDAYSELLTFRESARYDDREKTALAYTEAIIFDADAADDALWDKLHQHFTNPELVELGYFVALTLGQQRWIKTLRLGHMEVAAETTEGLAAKR